MILVCRRVLEVESVPIFYVLGMYLEIGRKLHFQRICDVIICTQVFHALQDLMYT
jgi:hypothetical protein